MSKRCKKEKDIDSEYEESDSEYIGDSESEYNDDQSEDIIDNECLDTDNIIYSKRSRRKPQRFSDLVFVEAKYDTYDRSSGFERNHWFGRKGENTIKGREEDEAYMRDKLKEKGYRLR